MNKIDNRRQLNFIKIFLFVCPFVIGIYHEFLSCIVSIILLAYLVYLYKKQKGIYMSSSRTLLAIEVIVLFYGISALWATDCGMALWGLAKFLPVLLFAIALMQFSMQERQELLCVIPISGVIMTICSFGLQWVPQLTDIFSVNNRLAGFFQYPNVFAVYLLVGLIVLAMKGNYEKKSIAWMFILLFGIFLSGSRTTFLLLIATIICLVYMQKNKKIRWGIVAMFGCLLVMTLIYGMITGNLNNIGRYLTISFNSSTFLGRLLYVKDALPVILRNPLGLGYMGYYFQQGSFQTGVYSVMFVHNEFFQMLLDIGWVPFIILVVAIVKSFVSKNVNIMQKMMLSTFCIHGMFDFDFQFIAIIFVLLLTMDFDERKKVKKVIKPLWRNGFITICSVFCIYMGIANGLYYAGNYSLAAKIYPINTNAQIYLLQQAETVEEMEAIADTILANNSYVSLAWSAKARCAYTQGDFGAVIEYKEKAISLAKYTLAEYMDYFEMLAVGVELYMSAGDNQSAQYCVKKIIAIEDMINQVLEETDSLGWRIVDNPELELPEYYYEYISEIIEE